MLSSDCGNGRSVRLDSLWCRSEISEVKVVTLEVRMDRVAVMRCNVTLCILRS